MLPSVIMIFQLFQLDIRSSNSLMNLSCKRGDLFQDVIGTWSFPNEHHYLSARTQNQFSNLCILLVEMYEMMILKIKKLKNILLGVIFM